MMLFRLHSQHVVSAKWCTAARRTARACPLQIHPNYSHILMRLHGSHATPEKFRNENDERTAKLVINLGAVSNMSLAAFKAAAGTMTGSSALLADAVHSLADLASDAVTYVSHRFARKAADPRFPYGRGRAEAFGSFLVSSTLVVAGVSLGWDAGLQMLTMAPDLMTSMGGWGGAVAGPTRHTLEFLSDSTLAGLAIAGTVGSIVVKEALYRWTLDIAQKLRSSLLAANAWHHRVDALTSGVAAVGVGGALLGVPSLDPLCALLVSASIIQQGVTLCSSAVWELLDRSLDGDVLAGVEAVIRDSPDVTRFARLRARRVGPMVHVDVELGVRPHLTISAAHHIGDDVRARVLAAHPQVADVLVHTFPDEESGAVFCADESCAGSSAPGTVRGAHVSHHDKEEEGEGHGHGAASPPPLPAQPAPPPLRLSPLQIEQAVRRAALSVRECRAVTHLRLHYGNTGVRVEMEVLVPLDSRVRDAVQVVRRVRAAVEGLHCVHVADVHLEVDPA